jgi:hypothetical protein
LLILNLVCLFSLKKRFNDAHTETRGMRMRTEGLENEIQHAKGLVQTLKNKIGELEETNINSLQLQVKERQTQFKP